MPAARPATTDPQRWAAVARRDARADGAFVYAVRSTGIYCRPSCPSRRPLRGRVAFFATPGQAEQAGFRACLRCRPREAASPAVERVRRTCAFLAAHPDRAVTLASLAARVGISPFHLQRTFKRIVGVSPRAFAEQCRLEAFRAGVRRSARITDAVYEAGYGSSSRLYERARHRLGMTPGAYRRGGAGTAIRYWTGASALGPLLIGATGSGLCAVYFGESTDALVRRLRQEFPAAVLAADAAGLASVVRAVLAYVEGRQRGLDLPLDIRATVFQGLVWEALRRIPYGEIRTYGEVALAIGQPRAARAVARACAANPVSLVIPCHRVVPKAGGAGGYRGGKARKQALLALEQNGAGRRRRIDSTSTASGPGA